MYYSDEGILVTLFCYVVTHSSRYVYILSQFYTLPPNNIQHKKPLGKYGDALANKILIAGIGGLGVCYGFFATPLVLDRIVI